VLAERDPNAAHPPARKVRFEQNSPQGQTENTLVRQVELLQVNFDAKVRDLKEELKEKVDRLQREIANSRPGESTAPPAAPPASPGTDAAPQASPEAYENSDWAKMVTEFGLTLGIGEQGSPAWDAQSPTASSTSGESMGVSDKSSPAVEWTIASPCDPRPRQELSGTERRLPQAPMHAPPKGPMPMMRAVSASLPEDCVEGGLLRQSSRPQLTVAGPRSARENPRPSLVVPEGSSSARVRVETHESRGTVGCLASPRRLERIQLVAQAPKVHAGYAVSASDLGHRTYGRNATVWQGARPGLRMGSVLRR
jgi:hypothetical protein